MIRVRRVLAIAGFCGSLLAPCTSRAQNLDLDVGNYTLISSKRVTRTIYEDVYRADGTNWGDADSNVTAFLSSIVPQISVVEGSLSFGDVRLGATRTSSDTFTVRHDRSKPFDPEGLVWTPTLTPLAPTSVALIEAALAAGVISDETALVYKVFVEFGDDRLPAAYRGRSNGLFEASATREAAGRFSSLSAGSQSLLAPFLLPPNDPGSWYALRAAALGASAHGAFAPVATGAVEWATADTTHLRVWWDGAGHPEDQARAGAIALEVERIWLKLTGLLGVPKPDDKVPGPHGGDARLDLYIVSSAAIHHDAHDNDALAVDLDYPGDCTDQAPTYIEITENSGFPEIIHELTHAILEGYKLKTGCYFPEYLWMHEATATWAEHFIYPYLDTEHDFAQEFLDLPFIELESPVGGHEYGAYLWFFYMTRGVDAGAHYVRETWDGAATLDSLQAIDHAIAGLGGFEEEWPQFALYNWNRERNLRVVTKGVTTDVGRPYRYYSTWDGLEASANEVTKDPIKLSLNGKAFRSYPENFHITHLASIYFHYDLRDNQDIRSVTLNQPYADGTNSRARVEVIAKIRGKDWEPAEDWTSFASKTLCRDKPDQDVEELIVVFTNSEFTNRGANYSMKTPQDGPAELKVSAVGCQPWIGTIDFTRTVDLVPDAANGFNGREIRESASTDATFELAPVVGINQNVYVPTSVVSTWHHTGSITFRDGGCSGTKSGVVYPASTDSAELITLVFPPPLGDGSSLYYQGIGHIDPRNSMFIPYLCEDGTPSDTTFGDGAEFDWWATRPLVIDPDENETAFLDSNGELVMRGDFQRSDGDPSTTLTVEKWHWELRQPKKTP